MENICPWGRDNLSKRMSGSSLRLTRILHHLMHQGLFREDLFYRLNVVPVILPPLRDRAEDIGLLVNHFQLQAARDGLPSKNFTPDALLALKSWHWPGNVRELENLVKRMLVLHPETTIDANAVEREFPHSQIDVNAEEESLSESVDAHIKRYFEALKGGMPAPVFIAVYCARWNIPDHSNIGSYPWQSGSSSRYSRCKQKYIA